MKLKSSKARSEYSPCLQSAPLMNGCTSALLTKTHKPVHTHKTLLNTCMQGVHTYTEFSQQLSRVDLLRGRAGWDNGLNSREGERDRGKTWEREREREGLKKRWEVKGGASKGAETHTELSVVCVDMLLCICDGTWLKRFLFQSPSLPLPTFFPLFQVKLLPLILQLF